MVVDDSGEDDTVEKCVLEVIHSCDNVALYKNDTNLGQAGNWNRCIELSKTKWIVIIHDDDMLCDNYLETVFPLAEKSRCTEIGVFQYKYDLLKHKDNVGKNFNHSQSYAQSILSKMRKKSAFCVYPNDIYQFILPSPGCWFVNREQVIKNGGFNADYGVTLDGIFHFKNIMTGKVLIVPDFLMIRRIEENTFLEREAQVAVIDMLYHFGLSMLNKSTPIIRSWYKIVLDISTIYLANGIKAKYNSEINMNLLLKEYGVNKFLLALSSKFIFLLNCILLIKLIFRKRE